jgi:hypothetical protein
LLALDRDNPDFFLFSPLSTLFLNHKWLRLTLS